MTHQLNRVLLERTDRGWVRAPARQEGDDIVLDAEHHDTYAPFDEAELPFALAKIHTPTDAVAFASRFGVIGGYPSAGDYSAGPDRQPFRDFELAAHWMRDLLGVAEAWTAATRPRTPPRERSTAIGALRQWALKAPPPQFYFLAMQRVVIPSGGVIVSTAADTREMLHVQNEDDFINAVTSWLAAALSTSTALIPHTVGVGPDRRLRHQYGEGYTLVDTACLHVADRLVGQKQIGRCEDCRHYFPLDDARQRFCDSTCASRARKRRGRANQKSHSKSAAKKSAAKRRRT